MKEKKVRSVEIIKAQFLIKQKRKVYGSFAKQRKSKLGEKARSRIE